MENRFRLEKKRGNQIVCKIFPDIVFVSIKYAKLGVKYLMRSRPLYEMELFMAADAGKSQ